MGSTAVAPHTASANHHHGDSETAIYVVSGHPGLRLRRGRRGVRLTPEPGDYVFVPPFTPHREENPTDDEAVVVLARSSQEAIVVNLARTADRRGHRDITVSPLCAGQAARCGTIRSPARRSWAEERSRRVGPGPPDPAQRLPVPGLPDHAGGRHLRGGLPRARHRGAGLPRPGRLRLLRLLPARARAGRRAARSPTRSWSGRSSSPRTPPGARRSSTSSARPRPCSSPRPSTSTTGAACSRSCRRATARTSRAAHRPPDPPPGERRRSQGD